MGRLAEANLPDYGYPASPGFKEKGGTSEEAAQGITAGSAALRERVLARIEAVPSTADEVAEHLGEDKLNVRPRISELCKLGKIVKTKERHRNASGARATVWRKA